MKNKLVSFIIAMILVFTVALPVSAFGSLEHENKMLDSYYRLYQDIEGDEWFAENAARASYRGLFNGIDKPGYIDFEPSAEFTREMAVAVLYRMEFGYDSYVDEDNTQYKETETPFADIAPKAWFAPFVQWASEKGIVEGVGGDKFGTGRPITREELTTILARYLSYKDLSLKEGGTGINEFRDAADVSEWAAESVDLLKNSGVITGNENGYFNPGANITRAEAATVFVRFDEALAFDMAYFFDFEEVAEVEFSFWRAGEYRKIITVSEESELEALLDVFASIKFSRTVTAAFGVDGGDSIVFKVKNSDGEVIYSNTFGPGRMGSAGGRVYFFEEEYLKEYYDALISE